MIKRELAAEIISHMEDKDFINQGARNYPDKTYKDAVDLVETVLKKYIMIQGQVME